MGIIRFMLAISVLVAHSSAAFFGLKLVGGQVAVESFYIISGFYMSLILNEKYIDENKSYKLFITNRILRLYPIYWVVLVITIIATLYISFASKGNITGTFHSYSEVKPSLLSYVFFIITNLVIIGQDIMFFLGIDAQTGYLFFTKSFRSIASPQVYTYLFVPQGWTISLELYFYLLAPFLLRKGVKIIFLGIIITLFLRIFLYSKLGLINDPWTYFFFPTELFFFLFGGISYRIYLLMRNTRILPIISACILMYMLSFIFLLHNISFIPFPVVKIIYFFSLVCSIPFSFKYLKDSKFDKEIGNLSYPIYICHTLIILCCGVLPVSLQLKGTIILVCTIIFSILLNKLVADPVERYRQLRLTNKVSLEAREGMPVRQKG